MNVEVVILDSANAMYGSGFFAGFMWGLPKLNSHILERPLSSLFSASISGVIGGFCTHVVAGVLPKVVKPYVPIVMIASGLYYVVNSKQRS
jgi:uncharacterized membrane protein YeiH